MCQTVVILILTCNGSTRLERWGQACREAMRLWRRNLLMNLSLILGEKKAEWRVWAEVMKVTVVGDCARSAIVRTV